MGNKIDCLLIAHNGVSNERRMTITEYIDTVQFTDVFNGAIAYLGTYLNKNGLTFDYINSFYNEKKELVNILQEKQINLVAITSSLCTDYKPIAEIVSFIKRINPNIKIVIGGIFIATLLVENDNSIIQFMLRKMNADFYINSFEGEQSLVSLIKAIKESRNYEDVPNLYYKKERNYSKTKIVKERNEISDNPVNWRLFSSKIEEMVPVRTAKSCPFSCAYCAYPQFEGQYKYVDVQNIEKELDMLKEIDKVKSINFIDDTFNVPADRFKELLRMMIKNKYNFKWHSHFRCQFADEEMVYLMKESGCESVFLGIESGNQEMLNRMNKRATVEQYRHGINLLNRENIVSFGLFMAGFPGETIRTAMETVKFIEETNLTFFNIDTWICSKFSPVWKRKEEFQITGDNYTWSHYTMNSKEANQLTREMCLSINNSIWATLPYSNIFQMYHAGLSLIQIKKILYGFNDYLDNKLGKI